MNAYSEQHPTGPPMDDAFYKLIRTTFRTRRAKPATQGELLEMYGSLVKSCTSRKFANCNHGLTTINEKTVKQALELNRFKNPFCLGLSEDAIQTFGIEVKQVPAKGNCRDVGADIDLFID